MSIEIQCQKCNRMFRIPDKYAGKRVKCPGCKEPIAVQAANGATAEPSAAGTPSEAKQAQWYLQTEDGQKYGPIGKDELDEWVAEGRADASCQLLMNGREQWKWAEEVYPELGKSVAGDKSHSAGVGKLESQQEVDSSESDKKPFAATTFTPEMHRLLAQTRPWVLLFAIIGFVLAGFWAIGGLVYGIISVITVATMGFLGVICLLGALVTIAIAAFYFFAAYFLFTYASEIAKFLNTEDSAHLERALDAQKSFWKLVGIVTAAALAAYLMLFVLLLIAMVVGAAAG